MEEEKYIITPKGAFYLSLVNTLGVDNINDCQVEKCWELFNKYIEKLKGG